MVTGTASVQAMERCSSIVSSDACRRAATAAWPSPDTPAAHPAASSAAHQRRVTGMPSVGTRHGGWGDGRGG